MARCSPISPPKWRSSFAGCSSSRTRISHHSTRCWASSRYRRCTCRRRRRRRRHDLEAPMITALHALMYSRDASAARAFLKDVLKFKFVDAGDGWLIFAAPPTELAVHPANKPQGPELYFMCDQITTTVAELEAKGA